MATLLNTSKNIQPKWLSYVTHGLAGLLSLAYLFFGGTKLAAQPMHVENFARWGYPDWFMYVTGGIEVLAALLIIWPATRFYGAGLLVITMIGAVLTHVQAGELAAIPFPAVLLILAGIVAWITRPGS